MCLAGAAAAAAAAAAAGGNSAAAAAAAAGNASFLAPLGQEVLGALKLGVLTGVALPSIVMEQMNESLGSSMLFA